MSKEMNGKVRMVRCPKCLQVLQEPANIPIYKCGGCGTVLQAKKRKNENTDPQPSTTETTLSPSLGDTLKGESVRRNQDDFEGCKKELFGERKYNLGYPESRENISIIREPLEQDGDESATSSWKELTGERNFSPSSKPLESHDTSIPFSLPGSVEDDKNDSGDCELESPESSSSRRGTGKSPTTRSYYGYYGSASSWDGDDQTTPGSPSNYRRSDFNPPSSVITRPEPDSKELLRMIYDLEGQIHKMRLGKDLPRQRQMSRVPFSGEVSHLCLHCPPQLLHCSAQLPRGCIYCNTPSEYSLTGHGKLHLREKYGKMRHLLPVASGAPIIACYYCSELLQIPADFALFKRTFHQLRCNACKNVLKFSVPNRKHVVPYLTEPMAPPPSEADDVSNAVSGRNQTPVSYSDYSRPCQSCSSGAEASSISPPSKPVEDRKMKSVMRRKSSLESEEGRSGKSPPLHCLMGYSSARQVLNG